jgi:type IX secretion system PorP/SprF family membrane protein
MGLIVSLRAQQLPYRTSFATADFVWNPAITAASEYMETGAVYRQQWLGFESAPSTAMAQLQFPFVSSSMSGGIWVMRDEAGPVQLYQAGGAYSYKIRAGRSGQFSIGLSASINQWQFHAGKAITTNAGDPLLGEQRSNHLLPNVGVGFYYLSNVGMYDYDGNGFFIGMGTQQLLSSEETSGATFPTIQLREALHANFVVGARFVNGYSFIEPSLWIDYTHLGLLFARANVLYEMEETFWAGGALATDYSISLQEGIILADGFLGDGALRIGGMGTYSVGSLGHYQGAGFEVVLAYRYWR